MENTVDPYKVLEVTKNFTLEELKARYRNIAVKVHPDKGGSEYMFNLVTKCFKHLLREYKRRTSDKQFEDLKGGFRKAQSHVPQQKEQSDYQPPPQLPHQSQSRGSGTGRFDLNKFNKVFDQNKLEDVTDSGYEEWYTKENLKEAPQFKGSTREAFNNHFEKHTKAASQSKHITKYEEPEPMWTSKIQCTELGLDRIDDFSGDNMSLKRLNFSDLKLAHSTSRIVDPSIVNRRDYQSVDELKRDRGNVTYELSDEDKRKMIRKQQYQEDQEYKRQQHVNQRDEMAEKHHEKMRNLLSMMK